MGGGLEVTLEPADHLIAERFQPERRKVGSETDRKSSVKEVLIVSGRWRNTTAMA